MESSAWVFTMFSQNRKIEQEEGSLVSVTFDLSVFIFLWPTCIPMQSVHFSPLIRVYIYIH